MVSAKEKSGNSTNLFFKVKKRLKKKNKVFDLDVDACMMIIYDPTLVDVALQKQEEEEGFEIDEDLKNEFMGFDELNVRINQMTIIEEEENCSWLSDELDEILNAFGDNADDHHQENVFELLHPLPLTNAFLDNILDDSISCTPASSSSEFFVEADIWSPSDVLNEIVNGFGDNADHDHDDDDNMFDLLAPLSDLPRLPLTNNAFIDNILDTTSDNWLAGTMVDWDQLFS